jgi:threonine dehydratase
MPETTPDIKIDAVKRFGGDFVNVVLHGMSFDQANQYAKDLSAHQGLTFIPPFDQPDVIAGQGTIARELLEQNPNIQRLFIAIGGGGLAAGIAVFLKQLRPDIQVMGDETFRLCNALLDDVITVSNDEICAAIKDIFDDTRVIAEPAGALSIAAVRKYVSQHNVEGEVLGAILCGSNTNFHTLRYVSERCELGEQKEAVFAVRLPERAGAFKLFCETLGNRSITEFNYRFSSENEAHVFVGIKLKRGREEFEQLLLQLQSHDYQCFDLSDNELAKLHVRHMVGGKPTQALNEHVFTFTFPEYPGALLKFLNTLGEKWNITLFHYRNHGAADGLVMCGFDIPPESRTDFDQHLEALGYVFEEQSSNPAYQFFLAH